MAQRKTKEKTKWQVIADAAKRLLPSAALAAGAALVDVGLLDARLYRAVAVLLGHSG